MGKGFIVLRACYLSLLAGVLLPMVAIPHASYGAEVMPVQQSIHQQERQRALEERLAPATPDVRLPSLTPIPRRPPRF